MNRSTLSLGLGLAILSAMAYGANIPTARMSALAGVPGSDIVFWRCLTLVPVLAIAAIWLGSGLRVAAAQRLPLLTLALATAIVGLSYVSSVAYVPVGVATIIFYIYPLLILLMNPLIEGERFTIGRVLIFCVAFVGLALAIGPEFGALNPLGLGLAALAALAATVQFFAAARVTRSLSPLTAGFWVQLLILPTAAAVIFAKGGFVSFAALSAAALPVVATSILFQIAFVLHLAAARLAPPAALGLVFCLEPVTSIALATVTLDEWPSLTQALGGAIVLSAVIGALIFETRAGKSA